MELHLLNGCGRWWKVLEKLVICNACYSAVLEKGYIVEQGVELFPAGALMLRDHNALVVSDLHLGCEAALEYQGLSLPRLQTGKLKRTLVDHIESLKPDRLIVAGDLKHNFSRNLTQEWNDIVDFLRSISDIVGIDIVRGNHDNYLGAILSEFRIPLRSELRIGRFRIIHGHSGTARGPTIMGHIHPSIALRDGVGGRVKQPCFMYDRAASTIVLPAMSIVFPGTDVGRVVASDVTFPVLAESRVDEFTPIVFVEDRPLVFPKLGEMRVGNRD